MQSVELARIEKVAQSLDRKIGIDHAHHRADEEEQKNDLQLVIDEEVECFA